MNVPLSLLVVSLLALSSNGFTNNVYIYRMCRGKWDPWTAWSQCSKSCNGGEQSRQRVCKPKNDLACWGYLQPQCKGRASRSRECNTQTCSKPVISAISYGWSAWSSWGSCGVSCGGGYMSRRRSCEGDRSSLYGVRSCSGPISQKESCNSRCCPVNSQWQSWAAWSACSASCGTGRRYHTRSCVPATCGGAAHCQKGQVKVYEDCNAGCCPAHGYWTNWQNWSPCSASCGTGIQKRVRLCAHPKCGGQDRCKGPYSQITNCHGRCCPVSGFWKAWSAWSSCSATCGRGLSRRYRLCAPPVCGGRDVCGGLYNQTQGTVCTKHCCPVNGYWKPWGAWSQCSSTCGLGTKTRARPCVASVCGGRNGCVGDTRQTVKCGTVCCPVDGGWAAWGQWSQCSASCGAGKKTRRRNCTLPTCGGKDYCVGLARQRVNCDGGCCHGNWTSWSGWSGCSVTCGSGTRTRLRQCQANNNCDRARARCSGSPSERQQCYLRNCEPLEDPPDATSPPAATGCRPPETITNGFYTPVEELYSVGDIVHYGCEIGFVQVGKVRLKCAWRGRWNRNPPECRRRQQ